MGVGWGEGRKRTKTLVTTHNQQQYMHAGHVQGQQLMVVVVFCLARKQYEAPPQILYPPPPNPHPTFLTCAT